MLCISEVEGSLSNEKSELILALFEPGKCPSQSFLRYLERSLKKIYLVELKYILSQHI